MPLTVYQSKDTAHTALHVVEISMVPELRNDVFFKSPHVYIDVITLP